MLITCICGGKINLPEQIKDKSFKCNRCGTIQQYIEEYNTSSQPIKIKLTGRQWRIKKKKGRDKL